MYYFWMNEGNLIQRTKWGRFKISWRTLFALIFMRWKCFMFWTVENDSYSLQLQYKTKSPDWCGWRWIIEIQQCLRLRASLRPHKLKRTNVSLFTNFKFFLRLRWSIGMGLQFHALVHVHLISKWVENINIQWKNSWWKKMWAKDIKNWLNFYRYLYW